MSETSGHGGARSGAGRPRASVPQHVLQSNKVVERKMRSLAEQGWEVLADSYPDLMRAAVQIALGDENHAPDRSTLKTLLELMVKVVGAEPEAEDNLLKKVVNEFIDNVQKAGTADGRSLDQAPRDIISDPDGRYTLRPGPGS